jgi:hypothetical protein
MAVDQIFEQPEDHDPDHPEADDQIGRMARAHARPLEAVDHRRAGSALAAHGPVFVAPSWAPSGANPTRRTVGRVES